MPTIVLKEVGSCIYCGESDCELTDEHIMPFALGGNAALKRASCVKCQVATSRIERHICRPVTGMMRSRLGIQSRRPKQRDETRQTFMFGDEHREMPFATAQFPAILCYPSFARPGIFDDRPPEGQYRSAGIFTLGADADFKAIADAALEKAGASAIQLASFRPALLMNFMAKVAHASAVGILDPGRFDPMLRTAAITEGVFDYILGNGPSFPPQKGVLHAIEIFQDTGRSGPLLIARLRWFANLEPPIEQLKPGDPILAPPPFLAAVGRPHGEVLGKTERAYINWMEDGTVEYGIMQLPDNWRSLAKPIPVKP
jgi:hypothetical protein